ncbi:FAD-dependent oxidoreductase [Paenalcaligenes hominis]|uniref:FAD-dependent oxidoreductase n=1 Tax=Paenalcaligenes hominis TaxID=643674 RepID=UPI0035252C45
MQLPIAPTPNHDEHHPIVVVGAGPVGLGMAIDLALRGQKVIVIDDDHHFSAGSRAICFAKRTLDIWDRLGVGERMVQKGVSWNIGKVFFRDEEVWNFNLLPEPQHRRPAFINLQQYYCEGYLYERAIELGVEIRSKHKVTALENHTDHAQLGITTPDGTYQLRADWLIACDGARSPLRSFLGQSSQGRIFQDRFLIADVRMKASYPAERWFWFDPPFHPNQSVLLHSQPDDVWRIDFQLGWDADPIEEVKEENVRPRVQALLGEDNEFEFEWISIYTFACERMDKFRFNRVLFAGDAAHRVSPFGARGANSGIQDTDNLAWKLDLHLRGLAPESLLDSYCSERRYAADENLAHSSRSTDFITPKSEISLLFRNTVLRLAKELSFARSLVNSGRLSTPSTYEHSNLNTPDQDLFVGSVALGGPATDAPLEQAQQDKWWLNELGQGFSLALFNPSNDDLSQIQALETLTPLSVVVIHTPDHPLAVNNQSLNVLTDNTGTWQQRYDAQAGSCYLFRPDQHLTARWRHINATLIQAALHRACGH